jgi:hypothetical protein
MKRLSWIIGLLLGVPLFAHDIITTKLTYTRDIEPIFRKRCISCHSSEASIPLTSYEEVRPWAVAIKEQVLSRSMPPWGAVKGFGDLAPDDSLTQEEITIIAAWVVGGAPLGKPDVLHEHKAPALASNPTKLSDALLISTRQVLHAPIVIYGIRPRPPAVVPSARITAHFPDGHIEPLLWLYDYDTKRERVFHLNAPLRLPRGTLLVSSTPLQFYLERVAKVP